MLEKKIVIIGGSIAGCTMAIVLQQLGFQVVILERSAGLDDRGAGITLPEIVVNRCIEQGLFDKNIPYLSMSSRSFMRKRVDGDSGEQIIWEQPIRGVTLNWADIYHNLRKRIDDTSYHQKTEVLGIKKIEDVYYIETSTGHSYQADFIIAADGVDSVVRRILQAEQQPQYAGYIAWRGLVEELRPEENSQFDQCIPYYVFPNGHLLLYRIPAKNYQQTGKTILNWVMYESRSAVHLSTLLLDKYKVLHTRSLPAGYLTKEHIHYLGELSRQFLPPGIADLIHQTPQPFIQAVFDFQLLSNTAEQILFVGDSALTLRPHSASGVLKALLAGLEFAQFIKKSKENSLTAIAKEWQVLQQSVAMDEIAKAKGMGDALVTHCPDWELMNQELMDEWWTSLMQGKTWYATSSSD